MALGPIREADIRNFLDNLAFRRQFVLGPRPFNPTSHWQTVSLAQGFILSTHPDLEVVIHSTPKTSVSLFGFILDPFNPSRTSEDIVRGLAERSASLTDLLAWCEPLSGRWALFFQDQESSYIFTDPLGFRQVYHYLDDNGHWLGSQPEIIKAAIGLESEDNEELLAFMVDPSFAQMESAWVGARTPYKGCCHLLPNHYLKLGTNEPVRFFPAAPLEKTTLPEIVETAAKILQGSFAALTGRTTVTQPITSGWDSRVLLAASRGVADSIEYYIDRQGRLSEGHPDVWLPSRMTKKLGIDFVIKDSAEKLPGWFICLLANNVTGARVLPKTQMIYAKLTAQETRLNINGNGGEICRNYFETRYRLDPRKSSVDEFARGLGYPGLPFVQRELENWQAGLLAAGLQDFNILDLLLWEQDLGTWGAQYPAEQDMAVEEFSPFNCRLLITTLLSAPRELRAGPNYPLYRRLIEAMWPELLRFPFNPAPKLTLNFSQVLLFLKQQLRPYLPHSLVNWLKDRGFR